MAKIRIPELTEKTVLNNLDLFVVHDEETGIDQHAQWDTIKDALPLYASASLNDTDLEFKNINDDILLTADLAALSFALEISEDAGNIIENRMDGVYAGIVLSEDAGNIIENRMDGLYVPTPDLDIDISADSGNIIESHVDGLYVPEATPETITTLVKNGDGTITYTSENGTITTFDLGDILPMKTSVPHTGTVTASGNTTIIAGPGSGHRWRIVAWNFWNETAVATKVTLKTDTVDIDAYFLADVGYGKGDELALDEEIILGDNEAIKLNLTIATTVGYSLRVQDIT